jgi:hypothetical protein
MLTIEQLIAFDRIATPEVIDYARRLLASPAPENYVALYLAKRYKCGTKVAREIVRAATPESDT